MQLPACVLDAAAAFAYVARRVYQRALVSQMLTSRRVNYSVQITPSYCLVLRHVTHVKGEDRSVEASLVKHAPVVDGSTIKLTSALLAADLGPVLKRSLVRYVSAPKPIE